MTNSKRIAFYPGSFDPITNGHVNVVQRGLKMFDQVIIALAQNVSKTGLFTLEERQAIIREVFCDQPEVEVLVFDGLMVNAAENAGAQVVLRGLRGVTDFEYEFQLATMNKRLLPELETVFLMTERDNFHVSSKLVREVASLGGDVSGLVPPLVDRALTRRFTPSKPAT